MQTETEASETMSSGTSDPFDQTSRKERDEREFKDYFAALKFNCDNKKIAEDCDRLGQVYEKAFRDPTLAFEVFKKNCHANHFGASCLSVGDYYYTGSHNPGEPRDMRAALQAYELGCEAHFSPACIQAGRILILDRDLKDIQRGGHFFERGCEGNNAEACALAANLYQYGRRGFDQNSAKALKYAIKACDRDNAVGCKAAADLYLKGAEGVEKDWDQYNYYRKKHNLLEKLKKMDS